MKVAVIGGGASGMIASIFLAREGIEVVLLEKNDKLGKKLFITGKGRCNLTNDCEIEEMFDNVVHGKKFVRSAIYGFTPQDTMAFFEGLGLKLVVERGNRVFPMSQKSSDVIKVLEREMKNVGVQVVLGCDVTSIKKKESSFEIETNSRRFFADKVVVATGGMSYPSTGSTGDGYKFAKSFGHKIVEPRQALVAIATKENVSSLQGISLKNVRLEAYDANGKQLASEFGEMLFTSRGVSGPIALSVSSYINRSSGVKLSLDLKPALDEKTLDARILRDFDERKNQDLKNVTRALLPERLNLFVLKAVGINENKKANEVTKEERTRLVKTIKNLTFRVEGLHSFNEAIITSGGVDLKDVTPSCESKLCEGLYIVGEALDIDALTGGFNLQLAFSSGVVASRSIVKLWKKATE